MALVLLLVFVVNIYTVLCASGTISLEYKPIRPSYAGITGGGNYISQTIPPGTPWPSKIEDYESFTKPSTKFNPEGTSFTKPEYHKEQDITKETTAIYSSKKPNVEDTIKETTSLFSTSVGSFKPEDEATIPPQLLNPNRPSFAGITGGHSKPQIIPLGKPWPAKTEDYEGSSSTSNKPSVEDIIKETTSLFASSVGSFKPDDEAIIRPQLPNPNRPSFAGITGGNSKPQVIPPGKPWPAKTEDYEGSSSTSKEPSVEDTIKETTSLFASSAGSFKPEDEAIISPQVPNPNRPSFAGITGGNSKPHIIPPGKPWPAKTEDYEGSSSTSNKPNVEDTIKETTSLFASSAGSFKPEDEAIISPQLPNPNRPSFAGITGGNSKPQIIPPGKPWPAKTEDYEGSSSTSKEPSVEDTIKETTSLFASSAGSFKPEDEAIISPQVPNPNRPSFAGITGGNSKPHIIPPGKPWSAKTEDYEGSSSTSKKPSVEDTIKETTSLFASSAGSFKPEDEAIISPQLPNPNRPSFAGITGGNSKPQIIPPGKPWPAKTEDYEGSSSTSKKPSVEDTIKETTSLFASSAGSFKPEDEAIISPQVPNPNRPSFAGITGGHSKPQIIPPGKPWPASPEDYEDSTSKKPSVEDTIKETTTPFSTSVGNFKPEDEAIIPPQLPNPNRPSFAGITGGNSKPQVIPPGKPWPAKTEDYEGSSSTSKKPSVEDTIKETTSLFASSAGSFKPEDEAIMSPQVPNPNRPSFAGITGGNSKPQIIPPAKPWPARPEDYDGTSSTSKKPNVEDTIKETISLFATSGGSFKPEDEAIISPQVPNPNRPSFAGITGGNSKPQVIPPGKPWPAKTEDYEGSSSTSKKPSVEDTIKETTSLFASSAGSFKPEDEAIISPQVPNPNRPSFAGITGGNSKPQVIPPGKPWPAKTEDYEGSSSTSKKPSVEDTIKETTSLFASSAGSFKPEDGAIISPQLPNPNRPSFAGITGGNSKPQIIPPGKPWPAKTEDYEGSSSTSKEPSVEDTIKETTSLFASSAGSFKPEDEAIISPQVPNPNRPSFAGITGGNSKPHIIPPGKPWSAKTEDYEGSSSTSKKPSVEDTIKETTSLFASSAGSFKPEDEAIISPQLPNPNRPSFAGITGGNSKPQIIPPGKPWPAKTEDYEGSSSTSKKPSVEDTIKETTSLFASSAGSFKPEDEAIISPQVPNPNRPSFAGITGGHSKPQIIPPGKPWPASPEDYEDSTSKKPSVEDTIKETTTPFSTSVGNFKPEDEAIIPPQLPNPNRPSFAGITGGNSKPQVIPPGKPWPAKTEDYEGSSSTSKKPSVEDTIKETTSLFASSAGSFKPEDEAIMSPQVPNPNRPSFAGITGGNSKPQIIPPAKPWPARPEDYDGTSSTSKKPNVEDTIKETISLFATSGGSFKPEDEAIISPQVPNPNRPSFAGITGGNSKPQVIPPGKPWPAKTEDYEGSSSTSKKPSVEDTIKETTSLFASSAGSFKPEDEAIISPQVPNPNRPSFAGITGGNSKPQVIPPGKPWPAKTEDYEGSSSTSKKPSVEDTIKETTSLFASSAGSFKPEDGAIMSPQVPNPSRPFFAGITGGNSKPQVIPPGKPWPAKTEDYEGSSLTSKEPSVEDTIKETTSLFASSAGSFKPEDGAIMSPQVPNPNRPSFAGITGGNSKPHIIPPGKPGPARPEDYERFNSTAKKPSVEDTITETTSLSSTSAGSFKPEDEAIISPQLPNPNRPSFAGITGGNSKPQIIPPGKPWPAKTEDYEGSSSTSKKPNMEDTIKETTTHSSTSVGSFKPEDEAIIPPQLPNPNRPSFAGITGGHSKPQIIPPAKPWPARPEDYEGSSSTSKKPNVEDTIKETTTHSSASVGNSKPEDDIIIFPESR